jgi:hypothetical protein
MSRITKRDEPDLQLHLHRRDRLLGRHRLLAQLGQTIVRDRLIRPKLAELLRRRVELALQTRLLRLEARREWGYVRVAGREFDETLPGAERAVQGRDALAASEMGSFSTGGWAVPGPGMSAMLRERRLAV